MLRALVLVLAVFVGGGVGQAAKRVALVIGNGDYETMTPALPNPANDALAVAEILHGLGFEVDVATDANKEAMEDALARLARASRTAEVTLFYYAGHGLQDQGRNYLAPIDATLVDETDLRRRFVRLDDVLDDLASAGGARILLLDACRDNDAIEALRAAVPATRSANVTRGLARVTSVEGQLVAFATQPDRVAADGDGENSPFTSALVTHLAAPGLELRTALTRVRVDVAAATNNSQIPEVSDSLLGEIYLKPDAVDESGGEATSPRPAASSEAQAAWSAVKDTSSIAVLKAYIDRFGDSFYAELARARLAELEAEAQEEETVTATPPAQSADDEARLAWDSVKDSSSMGVLRTFAARYPDSFYADLARARVAELEAQAAAEDAQREEEQTAAVQPEPLPPAQTEDGHWFVILGSFPHAGQQAAVDHRYRLSTQGYDARIIDTDSYPNLRNGLYAVVLGPFSKANAEAALPDARRAVGDAYIKSGH